MAAELRVVPAREVVEEAVLEETEAAVVADHQVLWFKKKSLQFDSQ